MAARVRHRCETRREGAPAHLAQPRRRGVDRRHRPGKPRARHPSRRRSALTLLLSSRRARDDADRRVPRPDRGRPGAGGRKRLLGQEPPRPARRGRPPSRASPREGRAPRRVRRALPLDRASLQPPGLVEEGAHQARARRRAPAHGRVLLPDDRMRLPAHVLRRADRTFDDGDPDRARHRRPASLPLGLVQGEAADVGLRGPASRPARHARGLAEGRPQLQAGDPERRRRGPARSSAASSATRASGARWTRRLPIPPSGSAPRTSPS